MFNLFKIFVLPPRTCAKTTFLFFSLISLLFAASQGSVEKRIDIRIIASNRIPINQPEHAWDPYQVYGVSFGLPTPARRLHLRFGLEGGKLCRASAPFQSRGIIHGAIAFHFTLPWFAQKRFTIQPFAGLSNTMVFPWESKPAVSTEVFSPSENEFGFVAGIEPVWNFGPYQVALPVQFDNVFSHPKTFPTLGVGLQAGRSF